MPKGVTNKPSIATNAAAISVATKVVDMESEELKETDVIVCTSQIPNLAYKDYKTGDKYVWKNVGDTEEISFATLKDIYRNAGSYIKNLWFTFEDERVITKFRLEKLYADYKDLVSASTYKVNEIKRIEKLSDSIPAPIKNTILARVKAFIADGQITDAVVIRKLEKIYDAELMKMIE